MRSLVRVQDRPWRPDRGGTRRNPLQNDSVKQKTDAGRLQGAAPTGVEPGGTRSKTIPSSKRQTPGAFRGQPPRQVGGAIGAQPPRRVNDAIGAQPRAPVNTASDAQLPRGETRRAPTRPNRNEARRARRPKRDPQQSPPYNPNRSSAAATASSFSKAISTITLPFAPAFTRTGASNTP